MNTNETIESKLERLSQVVSLHTEEKDAHRENLKAFMTQARRPVRSPYARFMRHGVRYASALMLVLVVSGTGMVSAAEGSRPGDALYVMKLKVTEPVRSALILDQKEKTEFEVERLDRRLKEFSLAVAEENPDPETTALIKESLTGSISTISEDVGELSASGDADEALSTNTDLKSLLSAHSLVLQEISERNPDSADDIESISASVDSGIAASENAEQGIEEALDSSPANDESVSEQASDTEISLSELLSQLQGEAATIDTKDRAEIEDSLAEINSILGEARAARDAGSKKDAYLLYTEAKERLDGLRTLVEADRDLGIGVIDSDEPAGEE